MARMRSDAAPGWRGAVALLLCAAAAWAMPAAARAAMGTLEVEDYFRLQRVAEMALSPDGTRLLYVVERAFPQDRPPSEAQRSGGEVALRMAYLQRLDDAAQAPRRVDDLADARAISWIPGGERIAYLARTGETRQLFAYDLDAAKAQPLTASAEDVEQYRFAADGSAFAYATATRPPASRSLYDRIRNETRGIVIDEPTVKVYDYLSPRAGGQWQPRVASLWIVAGGRDPRQVPVPGMVSGGSGTDASFHWSPDAGALSVTYVADDLPPSFIGSIHRSSLGSYDLREGRFRVVGASREADEGRRAVRYLGGEWWPDGRLLVRRYFMDGPWGSSAFQEWATTAAAEGAAADPALRWRPVEAGSGMRMLPREGELLLENTLEGRRGMFRWREGDEGFRRVPATWPGSRSDFRFSADFGAMVFVAESLTRPPEIYLAREGAGPVRVSRLNDAIAARVSYDAEEVRWTGRDGVPVKGWLLRPRGSGDGPVPLLTHVHGGPGMPVTDTFAPYLRLWTYPFEVQASRGTAVFFPNYRGTMGYGRTVAFPSRTDGEPADDVLTGIAHLVESGVADPSRLAISGHSHGAWLGPWVMTRPEAPRFVAASFAEGGSNQVANYLMMSSELNRYTHDAIMGASLFDDPGRYLEKSPDLHFEDVRAATLLEAGAWSLPLGMVGYAKAASYHGIPNEFVIYPNTGHNPDRADVAREIAERNLDWFAFWITGRESAEPGKQAQHARWGAMRAQVRDDR